MLYHLFTPFINDISVLNLFRYITFRTGGAMLTALVLSFLIGPPFIRWLKKTQRKGQPIQEDGPKSHLITKVGTPTMGGCLILGTLILSTLLWGNLANGYLWVVLGVTLGFGLLGVYDDYIKLSKYSNKGLSSRAKFLAQIAISLVAVYWIMELDAPNLQSKLAFPFFKNWMIHLGWFYIPFALLVLVGASNAVNLTDGLDGLAIVPVMIVGICFGIITYLVGNAIFANYLQLNFVPGSGELAVFCGALVGSSLGFLWFNAPPAMVFMGDTGSLAMGGALGAISLITKHEIVLAIIGGLFVLETVSVIIQVLYFKFSGGKRVFLMAPIHHHFEQKGWAESTIVIRFWIIAVILAMIGLSSLKLR